MLDIRLFGELRIECDGEPAQFPRSKKTRALLAYLIATGRDHCREQLCELLWEGPSDPRAQLRWSLSKLRQALRSDTRLLSERERVSFRADGAAIDLLQVRALMKGAPERLATEALCAAAECFQGEFLEGLDIPSCFRYQEWLIGERESLRALRRSILALLAGRLTKEKDQALRYARQRVCVDPLDEEGQVELVRLLTRLGRRREARAQYESCRRILASELGRRPSIAMERARSSCDSLPHLE